MRALEFSTTITNGRIELPKEHKSWQNAMVRVIVLAEQIDEPTDQKQNLRSIFARMQKVNLFESIEDPVMWQKNLRDEWE